MISMIWTGIYQSRFQPGQGHNWSCVLWQDSSLSQCVSPPRCINGTCEFNAGNNPVMDYDPIQGRVGILLVAACCRNQGKLMLYGYWPDADFTLRYSTV